MMTLVLVILNWMFTTLCVHPVDGFVASRKLIVISFDAFKPIYLEQQITPFMKYFYENGVRATSMNSTFPTKTFVNHFSIATGSITINLKMKIISFSRL